MSPAGSMPRSTKRRPRILVAYYSLTGHTARVAKDLAQRLDADIEGIEDRKPRAGTIGHLMAAFDAWRKAPARIEPVQHDPSRYAVTVVGTPVWAGQMTPAIRAYLQTVQHKCHAIVLFATSGDTDVARIQPSVEREAAREMVSAMGFSARDFDDPARYEEKLAALEAAVRSAVESASPLRLVS